MKSRPVFSRRYRDSLGEEVIITARPDVWIVLDRLIEELAYPVSELIDDVREVYPGHDFDTAFAWMVYWADDAQQMVNNDLANDNFRPRPPSISHLAKAWSIAA